ncbi:protein phosphatase 2C domain-containing protein [Pontibacter sp. KCTC 32443]|uniref:protein phosphatase 2C domain-containing protein n=1 Tax=Pontibacter TaxID=323449 RepID=UPI00164CF7AE|nr:MULTISPECIES: protein phosphatase 2C domain-containing protein [Pontibacter]MBC5772769.1 protein phosphatase 2C domain-containing protein [Pontibacter sp. KCTC 32443]
MAIKVFQLHKRASYEYKFIQDKFGISPNDHVYAIADGTTQSFNSEVWASLLTQKFISNPEFDSAKLLASFTQEASEFKCQDYKFSANPAKASLEREKLKKGATATFLGLQLIGNKAIHVTSVGDSNLFIINPDGTNAFPFDSAEALDRNQFFLNTESLLSNETETNIFWQKELPLQDESIIVLATDALSRLFLKHPNYIHDLIQIEDFDSFKDFCLARWDGKELEEDDITALVIYNFSSNKVSEITPPIDFSFPREKKSEFIPSFVSNPSSLSQSSDLSEIEMQHITNSVNQIGNELHQVKQSSKSQQTILLLLVGLVLLNTLLFAYFIIVKPGASKQDSSNQSAIIAERDATINNLQAEIDRLKLVANSQPLSNETSVILDSNSIKKEAIVTPEPKIEKPVVRNTSTAKSKETLAPTEDKKTDKPTIEQKSQEAKLSEEKVSTQKVNTVKKTDSVKQTDPTEIKE